MDLQSDLAARYIRIIALVSLLLGLNDAARLLGVSTGDASPLQTLGAGGFTLLAVFALSRLFAAVGLWIRASWGAVLLVGVTALELALYLLSSPDVQMTAVGFGVRLVLLVSILAVVLLGLRFRRASIGE